jgi:outer membrane protein, heavy metal efflux system
MLFLRARSALGSPIRLATVIAALMATACAGSHRETDIASVARGIADRGRVTMSAPAERTLPAGVAPEDGLSPEEAVVLALARNADLQVDLAELGIADAAVREAGQLRNPILTLLFPWGPKQGEGTVKWPIDALWLRPKRLAAARLEAQAVVERLVARGLSLVADTRIFYADAVLGRERSAMARQSARLRGEIAGVAEARLRSGDVSPFEISAARADRGLALDEASRMSADAAIAAERLRLLVGLDELPPLSGSSPPLPSAVCEDVPALLAQAAERADVRSAALMLDAAARRVGLTRAEVFGLTAVADANQRGTEGFELGPGIESALPLLNWNGAAVARARAEVERARARYVALRQRVASEVRESQAQLGSARTLHQIWARELLPLREEEVRQAQSRFDAGEDPYLLVMEAQRRLLDARVGEAESSAELVRARARVDRSVGREVACPAPRPRT